MPKKRKGKGSSRGDLWSIAGGEQLIVEHFLSLDILDQDQSFCSDVWSNLSQKIFGNVKEKNKKWLHCLWTYNRRDIRGKVKATSCISKGPELPTDQDSVESQREMVEELDTEDSDSAVSPKSGRSDASISDQESALKEGLSCVKKRHSKKKAVVLQYTDDDSEESQREIAEEQESEDSDSAVSPKSGRSDVVIPSQRR